MRLRAEHIWTESRRLHPEGQNSTTDTVLAELRESLDELKTEQLKTMPSDYEDELSAALAETGIEDLADIADGEIETLVCDQYSQLLWQNTMLIYLYRLMKSMLATNVPAMSQ